MTDKEKLSILCFYIGMCLGFMSKEGVLDAFKNSHPEAIENMYKIIYSKEDY